MRKISLTLALILIAATLGCVQTGIAFAASETIYTGVIEDLQKDETFDAAAYPTKEVLTEKDKVMDVIQIAESNAGELFLYVYQPQAGKFTASEVRISTSIGENLAPKDYKLTLLDRDGALEKYKVEELQFVSDVERHYLIVQLARPWDKQIDDPPNKDNDDNTVAYAVGKHFTVHTVDNNVTYTMEYKDYVTVVDKRIGYLRYSGTSSFLSMLGYGTVGKTMDSHYVAFTTDKPMDRLRSIDITYIVDRHQKSYVLGIETDDKVVESVPYKETYYSDNYANIDVMYKHYEWKRIQSLDEFIATEPTLNDTAKSSLAGMAWVLRFIETEVSTLRVNNIPTAGTYYKLKEVTFLRFEFDMDGTTYNLGVVDNKQSERPDQPPDNKEKTLLEKLQELLDKIEAAFKWLAEHWWVIIVGIVAIALIIGLIIAIVKKGAAVVFKAVGVVLWWILKIIFYIVTLPIWLIIWGVRAIKKGRENK